MRYTKHRGPAAFYSLTLSHIRNCVKFYYTHLDHGSQLFRNHDILIKIIERINKWIKEKMSEFMNEWWWINEKRCQEKFLVIKWPGWPDLCFISCLEIQVWENKDRFNFKVKVFRVLIGYTIFFFKFAKTLLRNISGMTGAANGTFSNGNTHSNGNDTTSGLNPAQQSVSCWILLLIKEFCMLVLTHVRIFDYI